MPFGALYDRWRNSAGPSTQNFYQQDPSVTSSTETLLALENGSEGKHQTAWKPSPSHQMRLSSSVWLHWVKDIIFVLFALYGVFSLVFQLATPATRPAGGFSALQSNDSEPCYCGNSIAEARQLGCVYDSLAAAWLPTECRDPELTAEFELAGPGVNGSWLYWADRNHSQPLTLEEVAEYGDKPGVLFHTTHEWHVQHCIFSWRKEHRSRFNNVKIEPRSDTEGHVKHCGMILTGEYYGTTSGVVLIS